MTNLWFACRQKTSRYSIADRKALQVRIRDPLSQSHALLLRSEASLLVSASSLAGVRTLETQAVLFYIGRAIRLGFINTIWDQSIGGVVRRHVLMTPLKLLDPEDAAKNPFLAWPGLACGIVYNVFEDDIAISPKDVIAHAAFRVRPASTFSIDKETVVSHSLDRGCKIPLFC
jgi:hypothetical protein